MLALLLALVVQAPLGWWLLRAIGTERLLMVWGFGMGTRLAALLAVALLVPPLLGWPLAPTLVAFAVLLVVLLFVEGLVALTARGKNPLR